MKVNDPYSKNGYKKQQTVNNNVEAKVVLLGDSGVGKSSIAQRFCRGIFPESHDVTIGGAYLQQTITLNNNNATG